jgi:rieske iron-sulfur protein
MRRVRPPDSKDSLQLDHLQHRLMQHRPVPGCPLPVNRRDVLAAACMLCAAAAPAMAEPADERPQAGDLLVPADAGADASALKGLAPGDIARPMIAWPMDPAAGVIRNGSRLNKVLLVRLDPATLAGPTQERAADGVVAYSAICPHAGCEVSGWIEDVKIFECPCHNSKYDPREAAAVVEGPAPRGLAALPLKVAGGRLAVARPFIGRLGIAPA